MISSHSPPPPSSSSSKKRNIRKYDVDSSPSRVDDAERHHQRKKSKRDDHRTESYYDYEERKKREQEERERERREREKDVKEVFGYTNDENPFGDANLTDRFVWKKKQEKLKEKGEAVTKQKTKEEIKQELLRAKENRLQRERERREAEEERDRLARERERSTYHEWEKKEEEFHLKQAKLKTDIRLKEGRAKPIDLIAKNLKLLDRIRGEEDKKDQHVHEDPILTVDDIDIEMREPYIIFKELTVPQLEELRSDIVLHLELDKSMKGFWNALLIVCDDELAKAKAQEEAANNKNSNGTINPTVKQAIEQIFEGKSYQELQEMETEIYEKTINPDPNDDVEYWDSLMKEIVVFKAKALLREFHLTLLEKHREHMQEERAKKKSNNSDNNSTFEEHHAKTDGNGSATSESNLESETEFDRLLASEQQTSATSSSSSSDRRSFTEEEMLRVAQSDFDDGDDEFTDEVQLSRQHYAWNDKYRPRKPKYFNRVHTGYEWNKYNQVHYDTDNPPPKTIQGYKFNIFYPDLIDKSKPPQYFIEAGKTRDTCIIRFHAGPPYEDIAFKIVNREWEKSHRRGFKCTFERGILHLYFRFKRYRYRR